MVRIMFSFNNNNNNKVRNIISLPIFYNINKFFYYNLPVTDTFIQLEFVFLFILNQMKMVTRSQHNQFQLFQFIYPYYLVKPIENYFFICYYFYDLFTLLLLLFSVYILQHFCNHKRVW